MSRAKKIKKLYKAQARADKAQRKAWRVRARLSATEMDGALRGRSVVKAAQADPFDVFLMRKAAGGDVTARELLRKRAADGDPGYCRYLERVVKSATSAEVRSGAAAELARLAGDGPVAPEPKWRWTAW